MDIGYVSYYIDNPVMKEILKKFSDDPERCMEFYITYGPNEDLTYPATFQKLMDVLPSIIAYANSLNEDMLRKAFEEKKQELISSFRYAKWNNGYLEEECNDGIDSHYTYSSRWGIVEEYARMDPCPDEDDEEDLVDGWLISEPELKGIPDTEKNDINNMNPMLIDNDSLSEIQIVGKNNLFDGDIEIHKKTFLMCGSINPGLAENSCEIKLEDNPSEADIISQWLDLYGSRLMDASIENNDNPDYLVIRFDACEEIESDACRDAVSKAVEKGIKIISEYQLWKSIFLDHSEETKELLQKALQF